ncbi:peptidase S74, partial [Streptococcus pneumoniae]|nr:peptidase S74 [Streptococcus pneumoniae]
MLYLLNKDVRTVRWNGEPLHEATSAIVKEIMNSDFTLTVKYPISDSGIYQLIQEDMLIKAPTPVLGAQLFRIKKPVEYNDHLEITAYHISDDVMQRSITPVSVTSQSCGMALSRMVQNTKTALGDFSFNSDIQDRRTFNTTETETLYSILLDGKHSIVGTWEGELVRDNFAMTVKKSRGENRGVVITTHKNLKNYQRTKNSQNVVTRIHAKSTFKPEGAEKETTIRVTVDSPLINSYPYINEKEYENNNAKTVEELQKWAQSKFSNEGIDKVSDAIKIEAYELDGQVVHMGDTVNLKSWKHNVDAFKKAIAYEFDALKEEYISLTFDDKAGIGGSRASGGLSSAADAILGVTESAQEIALDKALQNADLDFDHKAGLLRQEISDDIELAKAKAEEVKRELSDTINQRFNSFDNGPLKETKRKAEEALRQAGASSSLAQEAKRIGLDSVARLEAFKSQTTSAQTALSGDLDALKRTIANDIRPKQAQAETEIAKQVEALSRTKNELAGVKSAQATYEETTTRRLSELTNLANGKASKSELTQTAEELSSKIASVQASGRNLFLNSLFKQDIPKTGIWTTSTYTATIDSESKYLGHKALKIIGLNPSGRDGGNPKVTYPALGQFGKVIPGSTTNQDVTISFYAKANKNGIMLRSRLGNIGYKTGNVTLSTEIKRYVVHIPKGWTNESKQTTNEWLFNFNQEGTVWIWMPKFEISDVDTSYSEAPEDVESQISTVESTFKQRADSLDAGVNRLTEGLRTKVDISSLNVTAENIRQSVKRLETDTQNKLNQKLSQAEFEVRAGSIRQEILNATKDKASKSELTQTAEELSSKIASVQVGGRNYIRGTKRMMLARGLWASGTFRPSGAGTAKTIDVSDSPATGFDKAIRLTSSNARDQIGIAQDGFHISQGTYTMSCWVKGRRGQKVKLQTYWQVNDNSGISPIFTLKDENWTKLSFTSARNRAGVASIGYVYLVNAEVGEYLDVLAPQLEDGSLATSSKEAPEDIEGQISTVESTFKQRANSLDAGVRSLTEGLRTKVDISALNVTAENIRQSVKRLETDTQNKLNQKL